MQKKSIVLVALLLGSSASYAATGSVMSGAGESGDFDEGGLGDVLFNRSGAIIEFYPRKC